MLVKKEGSLKALRFNCSPKLDQPVTIPTRSQVRQICDQFKSKIVDRVFLVDEAINSLGRFVSQRFRVDVLHAKALEVEASEINVNASYDQDKDEQGQISIQLIMVTNPCDTQIIIDDGIWDLVVVRLADSLAHEMIHMRQARFRSFIDVSQITKLDEDVDPSLAYLKNYDEIDAYAYNIASELRDHPNARQILKNLPKIKISHSINLWVYLNTFPLRTDDPHIRRLLKKVYKHLT